MRILVALVFLFSGMSSYSQNFLQAFNYGGSGEEYGLRVHVDEDGNVYTVGGYESSIDFGNGKTLTANGTPANGLYVTKHNAAGQLQWIFNGGTDEEELFYLGVDSAQNVYVCGSFIGTQTYGTNTYTTAAGESNDNFIMKINRDGSFAWSRHINGPDHEHIQGMAVSVSGDIYISGFFDATFTYEGTTFNNNGNSDIFIMKFDTDNNFIWGNAHGGSELDWPWDLDVDENGNLYLAGSFNGSFNWDSENLNSVGNRDMLIVKLNSDNGSTQFTRSFGSSGNDEAIGIKADKNGSIFISGYFSDSLSLGPFVLESMGASDGIIIKLTSDGSFQWANRFGGTSADDRIVAPVIDGGNNILVGGSFNRDVIADNQTFTNAGGRDVFVAKYLTNGHLEKGFILGGTGSDLLGGINVNSHGKAWITGRFSSKTIDFGSIPVSNNGNNYTDAFLAEIGDFASGFSENESSSLFNWYPNPSTGKFVLNYNDHRVVSAYIYDARGSLLSLERVNELPFILDLSNFTAGVYFCRLRFEKGDFSPPSQLIKQ